MIDIVNTVIKPRYETIAMHFLPHDARVVSQSTWVTREKDLKDLWCKTWVLKRSWLSDSINMVRNVLPLCYFDEEKTSDWVSALNNYKRAYDDKNGTFMNKPNHDWSSHYADSFRYLSQAYKEKIEFNNMDHKTVFTNFWNEF